TPVAPRGDHVDEDQLVLARGPLEAGRLPGRELDGRVTGDGRGRGWRGVGRGTAGEHDRERGDAQGRHVARYDQRGGSDRSGSPGSLVASSRTIVQPVNPSTIPTIGLSRFKKQ